MNFYLLNIIVFAAAAHRYICYLPYAKVVTYHKGDREETKFRYSGKMIIGASIIGILLLISNLLNNYQEWTQYSDIAITGLQIMMLILDRAVFLETAFYGLEDILFTAMMSSQAAVNLCMLTGTGLEIGSVLSVSILFCIFINAGWDKFKSKDWRIGRAFLIFASLPTYRLFILQKWQKDLIKRTSRELCKFEIFHQLLLPLVCLILLPIGINTPLVAYLIISILFMASLIYPFNLNPIGIYGLVIIYQAWLGIATLTAGNGVAITMLTLILIYGCNNFQNHKLQYATRVFFGLIKSCLFSERHLHGLLLVTDKVKHNILKEGVTSPNDRISMKRLYLNNQYDVTMLRLLDVLERANTKCSIDADAKLLSALYKLFGGHQNEKLDLSLAQLGWDYGINEFKIKQIKLELYSSVKENYQMLRTSPPILPFESHRRSNQYGNYEPGFSKENLQRASGHK